MEILKEKISDELILQLINISENIFSYLKIDKSKIGYYNLFHNKWSNEKNSKYSELIYKILNEINSLNLNNIQTDNILYAGFIYSFPNCDNQAYHFDYSNKTETYFIPLIELTDKNGTEFLEFNDNKDYENNYKLLYNIDNKYIKNEDIINYLTDNNISKSNYNIKIHNSNVYSLYKLPKNVFHRGIKNETDKLRILFQIVTINDIKYIENVLSDELIINAQLDDKISIYNLNKLYLLKYNNKFLKLSKRGRDYRYSEIEYCDNYNYWGINDYKWYLTIKNSLLYIYHNSGLLLNILTNNKEEPFFFSIKFDDKYNWKFINNNEIFCRKYNYYSSRNLG